MNQDQADAEERAFLTRLTRERQTGMPRWNMTPGDQPRPVERPAK